ncbi:hypothetical protein QR685DRAFT_599954 [Neurospora intermedia]|uniref:Uncharacterized protein n=1 Tax=Neurospora intermedia TaxID=5142 RepID=A0ABR3D3D6_NEUIN
MDCKNERASEYVSVLVGRVCLLGRSRSDRRPVEVDEKGGVAKGKGPSGYQKEISSRVDCKSPSLHSRLRIEDRLVVDGAVTGHGRELYPLNIFFHQAPRRQGKSSAVQGPSHQQKYPIPSASPRTVSNVLMSEVPGTPHLHGKPIVSKLPTRPFQFSLEASSLRSTISNPT